MKVARSIFAVLLAAALCGCAQDQAQQRATELNKQYQVALNDCSSRFPSDGPKTIVAKVQCLNQAYTIQLPTLGRTSILVKTIYGLQVVRRRTNPKWENDGSAGKRCNRRQEVKACQ